MPSKRSCLPCNNIDVEAFLRHRTTNGADVRTISVELASKERMRGMGYKRGPGPTMLHDHLVKHITKDLAPVSTAMPDFASPPESVTTEGTLGTSGDVATTIQRRSLEMLERGEMRLTATNALKAQEMIDRRAEKQRDRELMLVLARVLTRESAPPSKYVGMAEKAEVIEGEVSVVE